MTKYRNRIVLLDRAVFCQREQLSRNAAEQEEGVFVKSHARGRAGVRRALIAIALAVAVAALPSYALAARADLTIGTIGITGDTYQLAMAWSNVVRQYTDGISLTPVDGGGTTQIVRGIVQGRWDVGFLGSPHYADAVARTGSFAQDPPALVEGYKNLRALFAVPTGMAQYVTRADSGLRSIEDLKGKRVSIGTPGGNAGRVTGELFKLYGIEIERGDIRAQYLDYTSALEALGNRQLDAALVWGGVPDAAIFNASRSQKLRFISPDTSMLPEFQKRITNGDFYIFREVTPEQIEAAYGDGVVAEEPAYFWTFQMQVLVSKDMPEDVAYELTKALWDHIDEVKEANELLRILDVRDAVRSLSAELHPGAARYFREIGVL